jgi:hypothetical protein
VWKQHLVMQEGKVPGEGNKILTSASSKLASAEWPQ